MLEKFFGYENRTPNVPILSTIENCTCCVIKSHVLIDGNVGAIFEHIASSKKFYIAAMLMFSLTLPDAEEFFEVYKGVLPEYQVSSRKLMYLFRCPLYLVSKENPNVEAGLLSVKKNRNDSIGARCALDMWSTSRMYKSHISLC